MDKGDIAWTVLLFTLLGIGFLVTVIKGVSGKGNGATFLALIFNGLCIYAALQIAGLV